MAWTTPVLLHYEGTSGTAVFTNDNTSGPTFAPVPSGVALLSNSNVVFGAGSLANGSDNSAGGIVSSSSLSFAGDFSIETRFRTANNAFNGAVFGLGDWSLNANSLVLRVNSGITSDGKLRLTRGGTEILASTGSLSNGTYAAIGLFRSGSTVYLTIDGALQGSTTLAGTIGGDVFYVGNFLDGGTLSGIGSSFGMFFDETRITDGLARQTSFPYTVASQAFTLDVGVDIGARLGVRGPKFRRRLRSNLGSTSAASANAYELAVDPASYTLTAASEALVSARALSVDAISYALTTSALTLSFGAALNFVPASYSIAAADESMTAVRALSIDPASYSVSASPITMSATRALTISPATYALTASAVTLSVGRSLSVDSASYSIAAAAETFGITRALSISPATYSLTAAAETLSVGRALSVSPGSYAITASAETLTATRVLSIDPASYVLSASAITLTYASTAKELIFDAVSYSLTAPAVSMPATRTLSIAPASYAMTAAAVNLSVGRQVNVDAATYSITAAPFDLQAVRLLTVDPSSYVISAPDLVLSYTPTGSIDYEELAAAIWSYTLSNGKTAEQTLVENNEMLAALTAAPTLDTAIEGGYSAADLLRIIAAVAAGKTSIDSVAPGTATVDFRDVNDSETRVSADMEGSERINVTINP